jgi:hypothetical protein
MISEVIYSIKRFGGKIIINGELGKREYTGLTKYEAQTKYLEEYNGKIFVAM